MDMPFPIPESLLPVLVGTGIWFGCCYIYFAPVLTERAIDLHVSKECSSTGDNTICSCVFADIKTGTGAFKNAVFLSTFSLSDARVKFIGNDKNPYIDYISHEMRDPKRRNNCDAPLLDAIAQAEYDATRKAEIARQQELEKQQRHHEAELEKHRQAQLKIADETTQIITDVTDAAINSPAGQAAKEKAEQAKEIYELQNRTANEILAWWKRGLDKSEEARRDH